MTRSFRRRLDRAVRRAAQRPVDPAVLRQARERLRCSGTWPDNPRIGSELLTWLTTDVDPTRFAHDPAGQAAYLCEVARQHPRSGDPVMEMLWHEAQFADEPIRRLARAHLRGLCEIGWDPASQAFRDRGVNVTLTCGSMALTLAGFPDVLARPPHQEAAAAVFDRLDHLRARIDGDRDLARRIYAACDRYAETGELPANDLEREGVLADAALRDLVRAHIESCRDRGTAPASA